MISIWRKLKRLSKDIRRNTIFLKKRRRKKKSRRKNQAVWKRSILRLTLEASLKKILLLRNLLLKKRLRLKKRNESKKKKRSLKKNRKLKKRQRWKNRKSFERKSLRKKLQKSKSQRFAGDLIILFRHTVKHSCRSLLIDSKDMTWKKYFKICWTKLQWWNIILLKSLRMNLQSKWDLMLRT